MEHVVPNEMCLYSKRERERLRECQVLPRDLCSVIITLDPVRMRSCISVYDLSELSDLVFNYHSC